MSVSFLVLIPLAVFGLVVVGGIAALCNKRTRWLGYLLLLLPVGLLALLAFRTFGVVVLGGMAAPMRWSFAMPIAAILMVGGVAALVALLVNKRTRPIGFVLLAVPAVLGCLAFVGMLVVRHDQVARQESMVSVVKQYETRETIPVPAKIRKPAAPREAAKKTLKPKAEASRNKSGRVVEAIGTALGKTLADFTSARAKRGEAMARLRAKPVVASAKKRQVKKPPPVNKTPQPKKAADKVDQKTTEIKNAEQIGRMVEVLSVAVQEELPENIEIDRFTVLRALGKLLGRMIASEQQDGLDAKKTSAAEAKKPEAGLETKKLETKKTSAVAVSAEKAGKSNDKPPTPAQKLPDWVDAQPQRVGDAYQMVFVVGPYTTRLECDQAIDEPLARAVGEYADLYLGRDAAGKATLPVSFLRKHVIKDQREEIFQSSVGPMVRVHVRLLFDARTNTELKESYRRTIVEERLWYAGGGLGAILIVLAGCFAVLKFEQATGGNYRGRMVVLFFVGVVLVVGALALVT